MAFDGDSVRALPILYNNYLDLNKIQADARAAAEERLKGDEASDQASGWMNDMAPAAFNQLNFRVPIVPPFPLHSVARGAGIALKNVDKFSFLMR